MKRSVAMVLATAGAAMTLGAVGSGPATASTATTLVSASDAATPQANTVTFWSSNHRAVFRATYSPPYGDSSFLNISGTLYDHDTRTARRGGKCAYLELEYGSAAEGSRRIYTDNVTQCGPGGKPLIGGYYKPFYFQLRVCQIPEHGTYPVNCGRWHRIYDAPVMTVEDSEDSAVRS
ncbi:hypothetical protein J5X84_20925 [Streptosporangiaceae bacterium NEAU-GS5]|nr:hypothetical protein [Streptosporangiaceae bacterium NEAU-GS5]